MDYTGINTFVDRLWEASALPQLLDYIRIPNKSPAFDPAWQAHGYMDQAVALIENWCLRQNIPGMQKVTIAKRAAIDASQIASVCNRYPQVIHFPGVQINLTVTGVPFLTSLACGALSRNVTLWS